MPHYTLTATRHSRRATDALRRNAHYWEVVTEAGGIVGAYCKADYAQAVSDAAMLRTMCGTVCDVRRAV